MRKREQLIGYILFAPALLGFLVFFLVPFVVTTGYSFTFGVGGTSFAGIRNYIEVLSSTSFRLAIGNTIKFMAVIIPAEWLLSYTVAHLLLKSSWLVRLLRQIMLLPMFLPVLTVISFVRVFFGGAGWLESSKSFWVLCALFLWKYTGLCVLFFLSGLLRIPQEYIETAQIEGASPLCVTRLVTLPFLSQTTMFVVMLTMINGFKVFREAFALGGAHPNRAIYMLQHFINNNLQNVNYQRVSVSSSLIFLLVLLFVLVFYPILFSKGDYDL